jgi:selenide,water dikinase
MPADAGTPVRPAGGFLHRLDAVMAGLPAGGRIAVIGGGAAGTELALAIRRRFGVRVALVCAASAPLPTAPPRARSIARAALTRAGVELACGVRALGFADGRLKLSDGSVMDADAALWATQAVGPPLLRASGLACDADGRVIVDATSASVSHAGIFAAVDGGRALAENLRRAALGRRLRSGRPRLPAPAILGLGDGTALGWGCGIVASGRALWRWKDRIDRRWMARYDVSPLDEAPAAGQFRATPSG